LCANDILDHKKWDLCEFWSTPLRCWNQRHQRGEQRADLENSRYLWETLSVIDGEPREMWSKINVIGKTYSMICLGLIAIASRSKNLWETKGRSATPSHDPQCPSFMALTIIF
jgi:hypothetical protein